MASLTGQLVAETYKALLKTIDNDILTASEKQITDGFGGGSNVFIDSQGFLRANKYKVTNGLATQFLKADGSLDANTYLTGITSSQIITALGYTPVTNARTLTINGTTYDLSANRSWTIAGTAAVWGNISGTLSDQTDLQNALNAKYNNPTGTISQYIRGDGTLATFPTLPGGLPTGGTAGQILAKIDATDYNTQWIDNYATQTKNEVKLGAALTKGTPVYVSSANGTNMIVSAASNTSEATSSKTFGLLETGGALNDQVKCVTFGLLAGLDTSTAQAGDAVWLGPNGTLLYGLANKPVAPAHMVYIGVVTRVQSNNGEIFVNVQNGFEIEELHDVLIQSKANNQGLFYESSTGLWKNKSIATVLGYTPQAQLNGTGFVKASGTTISYDNSTYLTTEDAASTYQRLDKMVSNLLASSTEYPNSNAVINALALKADALNPVFTGYMTISGAEPKLYFTDTDQNPDYFIGADAGFFRIYDQTAGATRFVINSSGVTTIAGDLIVGTIAKSGGTATQFLKADGSIDSSTYVTSATLANYLLISTAASTYQRLDKMVSNLLASDTEYPNSNAVLAKLALKADAANPVFTGDMTISGIAPKLYFTDTDNNPDYTLFVDSGYFRIYNQTAGQTKFVINSDGDATFTNSVTASSFIGNITGSAGSVAWSGVTGRPTTLSGYGITDAVKAIQGIDTPMTTLGDWIAMSTTSGITTNWVHVLNMSWVNSQDNWVSQLAFGVQAGTGAFYRTTSGAITSASWVPLLDATNYGSYALPLSGGTITGIINNTTTYIGYRAQVNGTTAIWRGIIGSYNASSDVATFIGNYAGRSGIYGHSNSMGAWNTLRLNSLGIYGMGKVILSNNTVVNANDSDTEYGIIHAGNIGSQSVNYANYSGYSLQLNGYANQTEYTILTGPANGPVWKVRYDSATANRYFDLGFKDGNGVYSEGLKIYNGGSPTWAGNPLLHSGNYGSYALPLSGGTMTGGIAMGGNYITNVAQLSHTNGTIILSGNLHIDAYNGNTIYLQYYNRGVTLQSYCGYNLNGYNITGAANILASDSVDIGSNSGNNVGAKIYYSSSYYGRIRFYNDGNNGSTIHSFGTSWVGGVSQGYINIDGQNGVNFGAWNDPDFGVAKGGTATAYRSLNVNGGGTHSGTTYFVGNGNTGSVAGIGLNVYSNNGSGAVMAFHRGGYYAVNMGLDSDNVFRIGGWSASANRLQLDMSGNLTLAASVNAPSGYVSTPNPWSTNNSAFFPNGITTAGTTNWIYGSITYIGNAPSNGAGHQFNSSGSATSTGGYTAAAFYESSDFRLKTLIEHNPIINGIEHLEAKLYEKNGKIELGYFAQDAEKLMPYAVTKNEDGFLNLSYREVHTAKIARLEKRVAELEKQLNAA
jgi:hypothetical protein